MANGKMMKLFRQKHFFRSRREKMRRDMRNLVRSRVLALPDISLPNLRYLLIAPCRLRPCTGFGLIDVKPGLCRQMVVIDEEEKLGYMNELIFWYVGSTDLLLAGSGAMLHVCPEGEVTSDRIVCTIPGITNSRQALEESAKLPLLLMRRDIEAQLPHVTSYNDWLEREVDRAIVYYDEHIPLWRLEGKIDEARLAARSSAGRQRKQATA